MRRSSLGVTASGKSAERLLCSKMFVVQGIAWFPEKDAALLEALQRWAIALPHMLLFHVCEGHDKDEVLKVCRQGSPLFHHTASVPALLDSSILCPVMAATSSTEGRGNVRRVQSVTPHQ